MGVRRAMVLGFVALGAAAALAAAFHGARFALQFAAGAIPAWAAVAAVLWRERDGNRVGAGPLRPALGPATRLTLGRALLVSALAGFVLPARPGGALEWLPAGLYTAAAICDRYDGYLARRLAQVTALGAELDTTTDGLGLLVASLVAVRWGQLPPWYLTLGVSYYLFWGGLQVRARLGLPAHPERLRPSPYTRMFAGLEMGLCAAALYPALRPPATTIAAALFLPPPLILFARDWLVVTGRLSYASPAHLRAARLAVVVFLELAPMLLRLGAALGVALLVARHLLAPVTLFAAALMLLGIFARASAFWAAVPLALLLPRHPTTAVAATFAAAAGIVLLGAGRRALFSPEDARLLRPAGAPR
jgi:CDP-diacylglycerol--glycerol-3-phosphate 3-phosphatidyltransferase